MRREYAKTYAYLKRFKPLLVKRAAYRRYQSDAPFYSMYNVGADSLSPRKVVWRRMDRRINAAIVETHDDPRIGRKPILCQETCVEIALSSEQEAFYLLAELKRIDRQLHCAGTPCPWREELRIAGNPRVFGGETV